MKVINFFGSSGSGKSTQSLKLAAHFKEQKVRVEYVPEYAKYLVYSKHDRMLMDQFKIFAEQRHHVDILKDHEVEFAIMDSPLVLGLLYGYKNKTVDEDFAKVITNEFNKFDNINFFVSRNVPFDPVGRIETAEGSDNDSVVLKELLNKLNINYVDIDTTTSIDEILNYIKKEI